MASNSKSHPLKWYENLLLILLAQSPRIEAIHIKFPAPPEDDEDEEIVSYLERLYKGPCGEKPS